MAEIKMSYIFLEKEKQDSKSLQEILLDLMFHRDNIFYFPEGKIPEEIAVSSNYVRSNYKKIIDSFDSIDTSNAKEVVKQISFSDHGDDNHISDTLSVLLYKWTQEDGNLKNKLVEILDTIFNAGNIS